MNSVIVLCVGLMGAANPALDNAENPQPVQVAFAGCNIASGGCYQQPGYRSPVAQRGPVGYSTANCNCPPGACANGQCSLNCPNGQCRPVSYTSGTAANCPNGQCGLTGYPRYTTGTRANCPNGQCSPNGSYAAGKCYGPNCPPQNRGTYSRSTGSQYHILPYPAANSTQPRRNPYAAGRTQNVNWTNTARPVQPAGYSNSNSPFFE